MNKLEFKLKTNRSYKTGSIIRYAGKQCQVISCTGSGRQKFDLYLKEL